MIKDTKKKRRVVQCHKCPYNGRTDKEAAKAHLSCKFGEFRRFPGCGVSYFNTDDDRLFEYIINEDGQEYLNYIKHDEDSTLTNLPKEIEDSFLSFLNALSEMDMKGIVLFWSLLNGETLKQAGIRCGMSKEAVQQRVKRFSAKHKLFSCFLIKNTFGKYKRNGAKSLLPAEMRKDELRERKPIVFYD